MRERLVSKLIKTKWGLAIYSQQIKGYDGNKKFAFLEYGGHHTDFDLDKKYNCEIFYRLMYAGEPDDKKSCKEWSFIDKNSVEEIFEDKRYLDFKKKLIEYDVKNKVVLNYDVRPHFNILKEKF